MKRQILILLTLLLFGFSSKAERFIDEHKLSLYRGYRFVDYEKTLSPTKIDFLNYIYTQPEESDYQYTRFEAYVKFKTKYSASLQLAIRNTLIPYSYDFTLSYLLNKNYYLLGGSFSERFYLTEFNGSYKYFFNEDISVRYINRQWNFSFVGFFVGVGAEYKYRNMRFHGKLKSGVLSVFPFQQRNIIKFQNSNYKLVHSYNSRWDISPFIMPQFIFEIDLFRYKNIFWGARFGAGYLYSKPRINYELSIFQWTYDSPEIQRNKMPSHIIQQFNWDFGVFIRW